MPDNSTVLLEHIEAPSLRAPWKTLTKPCIIAWPHDLAPASTDPPLEVARLRHPLATVEPVSVHTAGAGVQFEVRATPLSCPVRRGVK